MKKEIKDQKSARKKARRIEWANNPDAWNINYVPALGEVVKSKTDVKLQQDA